LVALLDDAELASDARFTDPVKRVRHREPLYDKLSQHFRTATREQWLARLHHAGILVARVNEFQDLLEDPVFQESGVLIRRDDVVGVRSPVRIIGVAPNRPAPLREVGDASFTERARQ
jgi:crotonobetainyl-CoA:carnitine CoA-transferase CaiB-like acyl-CoA transferase